MKGINRWKTSATVVSMAAMLAIMGWFISQVYQPAEQREETLFLDQFEFTQIHMGMPVTLTVWADSRAQAEASGKRAFKRISELENVFSDYIDLSDVDRVNRAEVGKSVSIDPSFKSLLEISRRVKTISQGAFDPTTGRLIQLWRASRKTKQLPDPDDVAMALKAAGLSNIELVRKPDPSGIEQDLLIKKSDLRIDFGGIAKGFIGDRAIQELARQGIRRACYEAGGDIVCSDPPPGMTGWAVDVPGQPNLKVANCAVAVSGDTVQYVTIDGVRYSHVVDVRTGMASTTRTMAVVIGPSGAISDALATAGCVLDPSAFKAMVESVEGARGWQLNAADLELETP